MSITTDQLRSGAAGSLWLRLAAVGLPLLLIAPAFWNGYPLLQWDTGGYLARWYEGYLVPSRSTVFGLYLHYGENFGFWINLAVQSLATLWLLQLTLRVLGLMQTFRFIAISLVLILSTALPWLASMLLTDILRGSRSCPYSCWSSARAGRRASKRSRCSPSPPLPPQPTAPHSACCSVSAPPAGWCGRSSARACRSPDWRRRASPSSRAV
ncbi:hypothetical protein J2R70_004177 [Bradyrhizobium japonicum]|nr:hypothetical protein [Bradyrhizobium japonicum]